MIKIYHNPRCRKSREALQILQESGKDFEIIEYLKESLSFNEVKAIIDLLDIPPIKLLRKNEAVWKENFKNKELNENEVIEAMVTFPKLIERPIVINGELAVIGRPPEKIKELF